MLNRLDPLAVPLGLSARLELQGGISMATAVGDVGHVAGYRPDPGEC